MLEVSCDGCVYIVVVIYWYLMVDEIDALVGLLEVGVYWCVIWLMCRNYVLQLVRDEVV